MSGIAERLCCFAVLLSATTLAADLRSEPFTAANSFTSGIEGPAVDSSGNVLACNFERGGTIGKVSADGKATLFAEMPAGGRSAGLHFDRAGFLIVLDHVNHLVYRADPASGKFLEVLTTDWTGPAFRQPNDLAIASDDAIYFTDPDWSSSTGGRVFVITFGPKRRTLLVADQLSTPNGVSVSPDGRTVYVAQSRVHNVLVFNRQPDGTLRNQRVFFNTAEVAPAALPDGVRCDSDGNVYVALHGAGRILGLDKTGPLLPDQIYTTGSKPTNIAISPDGRTMFITETEHGRLERVGLR
jgi:gluconolactonase